MLLKTIAETYIIAFLIHYGTSLSVNHIRNYIQSGGWELFDEIEDTMYPMFDPISIFVVIQFMTSLAV